MNAHLATVLSKEVSRKEFLGMSALALASVFGLGTIIKLLTGKSLAEQPQAQTTGYGSSAYGGRTQTPNAPSHVTLPLLPLDWYAPANKHWRGRSKNFDILQSQAAF